ncbi:MAG: DsrE family protein [Rhodocyclaceae bacterium]|nr:DsrE family protein [Rhodocyclaceae bacterium]
MSHRIAAALAAALFATLALPAPAAEHAKVGARPTAPQAAKNRIVIQINEDDGKKWMAVLANIKNIQAELGQRNVAIAVVAIGAGLGMLAADSIAANEVEDAIKTGVEFIACGNSMTAQKVAPEDLVAGSQIAKAGYVEIMRRQQAGWTYLRP